MFQRLYKAQHSIATKLYSSSFISSAAVLILAVASVHFAVETKSAASRLYQAGVLELQHESRLEVLFEQHRRLVQAAPAELDRAKLQSSRLAAEGIYSGAQGFLQEAATRENGATLTVSLRSIAIEMPILDASSAKVFRLAENFAQEKALQVSHSEYGPAAERVETSLKEWRNTQLRLVDGELSLLSSSANNLTLWVFFSGLLAFVLIGPIGVLIQYRILTRLGSLTAVMRRLSKNDVTVTIPFIKASDEIGHLARATNIFKNNAVSLTAAHIHLDAALNNMSQGLCMYDQEKNIVLFNHRFLEIYRLSPQVIKPGTSLFALFKHSVDLGNRGGMSAQEVYDRYCDALITNGFRSYSVELADGRAIAVSQRAMLGGGWVDTHEDITERVKAEAQIKHMALHDGLTNLPNRILFQRKLNETLEVASDAKFAVLCLDLDGFKNVNDSLGHPAGDKLLKQVSERLTLCVKGDGLVSRLGGDEFAILQPDFDNTSVGTELVTSIIEALSKPYDLDGHQTVIGASVGVAVFPNDGLEADQLLKNADIALYGAKSQGRGTFRFFEAEMDARLKARRALELDLRCALEKKQFEIFYQPIINIGGNEVTGFEALLRWRHPERGLISPAEFIPVAEETGLIIPIGEWVLRGACAEAASWPGRLRIAVNLSPVQFRGDGLANTVFSALAHARLEPNRLELEITESVLLQDSQAVLDVLRQLKSYGVRISMDDFGTGYSSLSYLRSFPFDKIKIDQSFIRGLGPEIDSLAIIRAVTGLGASLNMTTTAEGVETQDQLDLLRREGCNEVQGFLFSPAIPAAEIGSLLTQLKRRQASAA